MWFLNNRENKKIAEEISQAITINEENVEEKEKYKVDFQTLKEKNSDTVGFLKVNGTNIEYTVVKGTNNSYYLKHNFNKESNSAGWIFADYKNKVDGTDKNIVIYGHNMKNGSMFNNIKSYTDQSFADEHPYVYIYLPDGTVSQYKVVVGHIISESSVLYSTQIVDTASFVQEMVKTSSIKVDFDQSQVQSVITLSTCTSAGSESGKRNVVHAILQRKGIDPVKEKMEN